MGLRVHREHKDSFEVEKDASGVRFHVAKHKLSQGTVQQLRSLINVVVRKIISPPIGKNGLFIQPNDASADRETIEQKNRDRFASHFKFADPFTGLTRTYDDAGDYNCGRCNQADGTKCLLVKIAAIDRTAGSCGDWENLCAGDAEMTLHLKSPDSANYGVAQNGVGFGCHRCPYASPAHSPDSRGRELYCGKGDFRTFGTACCAINGAPVK